jgi:hypothetical protein
VIEGPKAGRRSHAFRREGIFQGKGNTVQRARRIATRESVVGGLGSRTSAVGVQRHDGVQPFVMTLDLRKEGLEDFGRGHVASANSGRECDDAREDKIGAEFLGSV